MYKLHCDLCGKQIFILDSQKQKPNCAGLNINEHKYMGGTSYLDDYECDSINKILCDDCLMRLYDFLNTRCTGKDL